MAVTKERITIIRDGMPILTYTAAIRSYSWEAIQLIRKGIRAGEMVTPEQEAMLNFLGIDHGHIRDTFQSRDAVRKIQWKVSGKSMAYRRKGLL